MATTYTATYNLAKPEVGASEDTWGGLTNGNWDDVDELFDGTTAIAPNLVGWKVGGAAVTSTAAELNILDGVTATTAELNTLDGITATVTELNYSGGVTSNIQTQLDAKQALDGELTAIAGLTSAANKVPYFTGSETAGMLDFVDEDDMASDSATAIPSQQSVKAHVADAIAAAPSPIKAWVTFNGTGTVAIQASSGVSSVTDNGSGDYTVNLSTAMVDANYAILLGGMESSATITGHVQVKRGTQTTTSFRLVTGVYGAHASLDIDKIYATVVR